MISVLDLFSGIGGFSLGLTAAGGFETHGFVEMEPFCQQVLRKHWPAVPIYADIHQVTVERSSFDLMCGGFPCQDISVAGGGELSIVGQRSGLWFQFYRLISEGLPHWVLIENVAALRRKGLIVILRALADLGYDAEWHIIPAYAVGKPHRRERLWVVAHLNSHLLEGSAPFPLQRLQREPWDEGCRRAENFMRGWGLPHTGLQRGYNGIPSYVDRIRALGNAIIPEIALLLGEAIMEAEAAPQPA